MRSWAAASSIMPAEASRMSTCDSATVASIRSLSSIVSAIANTVPSRMTTSAIQRKLSTAIGPAVAVRCWNRLHTT